LRIFSGQEVLHNEEIAIGLALAPKYPQNIGERNVERERKGNPRERALEEIRWSGAD
jgi:hypothetical protein